jgi:activator of HSP90 ATPase
MAKVGEEDPRWIVEDLGNKGTNVNDWHWTEVNVLPWCTERAHKLFDDKTIVKSKDITVTVNVEQVSGEATVSNRKRYKSIQLFNTCRKLLAFYELNITLKWNATIPQGGSATGKVNMPYISDESENDEIEVDAVADTKSQDAQTALKHMNQSGILAIKKILFDFLSELRAGANMASMVPPEEPKEEKEVKPVKEEKKSKKEGPLSQYEIIKDLSDGAFSKYVC